MGKARPESTGQSHQFDAFLVGTSTFGRLRSGARALYFTVETFKLYASWCYVRILVIAILCNQTLVILTVTLTMTDVPSKYVWKIKESRIVFKGKIVITEYPQVFILSGLFRCLFTIACFCVHFSCLSYFHQPEANSIKTTKVKWKFARKFCCD